MRSTRGFSLVFAALALLACTKVKDLKVVDEHKPPLPRPADVVIEASLPSLDATVAGLKAYANKVKPGVGALLDSKARYFIADLGGLSNLDGVKADAPVWALVLNPKPNGERSVLVVSVGDEKKLRESAKDAEVRIEDGRAVVGKKDAVDALAPYAFATLARQKAPEAATITVFVPALRAAFGKEIDEARKALPAAMAQDTNPGLAKILDKEMDALTWLLDATDAFEVRLEVSADDVSLELAAVPTAGKAFATYVAAQKPADGAMLARLPASANPAVVGAGKISMGPFSEQMAGFMNDLMVQVLSLPASDAVRVALADLFTSINGNFAVVASLGSGGIKMQELIAVNDGAKAMAAVRTFAALLAGMKAPPSGPTMKVTYAAWKGNKIEDVPVVGYVQTIDMSGATPEQIAEVKKVSSGTSVTLVGAWDDVMGITMGDKDGVAMKETILAARGQGPRFEPGAALAQLLDASRKRGESFAAVVNLAVFTHLAGGGDLSAPTKTPGIVVGVGFQGGRARMRFEVPSAHLRELQGLEP